MSWGVGLIEAIAQALGVSFEAVAVNLFAGFQPLLILALTLWALRLKGRLRRECGPRFHKTFARGRGATDQIGLFRPGQKSGGHGSRPNTLLI